MDSERATTLELVRSLEPEQFERTALQQTFGELTVLQWLRGGVAIAGATGPTYTLVGADVGELITFAVTPAALTGVSPGVAAVSGPVGPVLVANTAPVASGVSISGTAEEGYQLTGIGWV